MYHIIDITSFVLVAYHHTRLVLCLFHSQPRSLTIFLSPARPSLFLVTSRSRCFGSPRLRPASRCVLVLGAAFLFPPDSHLSPLPQARWKARRIGREAAQASRTHPTSPFFIPSIIHHCLSFRAVRRTASHHVFPSSPRLALLFAVENELESTLDKLVLAGISLDTEFELDYTMRPLHIAALMGLRVMVTKLLWIGLPVRVHAHSTNPWARTALDFVARQGHLEIVRILAPIRNDVPLLLSDAHEQYLGRALRESMRLGSLEISRYLVSEGADINFLDESDEGLLLASGADPNAHTVYGFIPLFVAANIDMRRQYSPENLVFIDNVETLRFFLERGADPNHADTWGRTPFHSACLSNDGAKNAKARVELLLQFGAHTVEKVNGGGVTPVDYAMQKDYSEVVKTLEPLVQDPELKLRIAEWWEKPILSIAFIAPCSSCPDGKQPSRNANEELAARNPIGPAQEFARFQNL
ncbi:ankyrin repeat-containing domain protein [Mycena albidolilacea]|uniref:Ankyrin repeat-containing domain protein n=1 Tax=Mycena albidolilacea TaxID=1033008 RepID=A0AAD7EZM7_9AGAR|nr:ankyrin repeat-containing domain protein [Mycena albidolilacea]